MKQERMKTLNDRARAHRETEVGGADDAYQERRLAAVVVKRAVDDFIYPEPPRRKGQKDMDYQSMLYRWQLRVEESYRFLVGRTEIAAFWFNALNLPFFTGTQEELHAKLIKWGEGVC